MTNRIAIGAIIIALAVALISCGGPEEKKAKFFNRARALFDKGDFVKARLELKNALQIDPEYADSWAGCFSVPRQGPGHGKGRAGAGQGA